MIYVNTSPIENSEIEQLNNIGADFKIEQSVDGMLTVSFTTVPSSNNPGYDYLVAESTIMIEDYMFVIKQMNNTGYSKSVVGVSIFFERGRWWVDGIFSSSNSFRRQLEFALGKTDWTYTIGDALWNDSMEIPDFGDDSSVALVNRLCEEYGCEYEILPNFEIHFDKQVGPDNDFQYRYGYNISDVVLIEDSTNLHTYIRGFGKDGLYAEYESPNIGIYRRLEAPPVRDESFTDYASLRRHIRKSIKDEPDITINSRSSELTSLDIGEHVWLIYPAIGTPISTRVLKNTRTIIDGRLVTSSVVLGNTLLKTSVTKSISQDSKIKDMKVKLEEQSVELKEAREYTTHVEKITYQMQEVISEQQSVINEQSKIITNSLNDLTFKMGR